MTMTRRCRGRRREHDRARVAWGGPSDRGIPDYRATPGNRGACLLRRVEGDRVHFLLISLWDSRDSIAAYAGPDIDQARYFPYDRECLVDPERQVTHYDVLVAPEPSGG